MSAAVVDKRPAGMQRPVLEELMHCFLILIILFYLFFSHTIHPGHTQYNPFAASSQSFPHLPLFQIPCSPLSPQKRAGLVVISTKLNIAYAVRQGIYPCVKAR
jgi:hypothetical protein